MSVWESVYTTPRICMSVWGSVYTTPRICMSVWESVYTTPRICMSVWGSVYTTPRICMSVWGSVCHSRDRYMPLSSNRHTFSHFSISVLQKNSQIRSHLNKSEKGSLVDQFAGQASRVRRLCPHCSRVPFTLWFPAACNFLSSPLAVL